MGRLLGNVLFDEDEAVYRFVKAMIPNCAVTERNERGEMMYRALGVLSRGDLVAGVVYHNARPFDVEVTVAAASEGLRSWTTRQNLAALYHYPFFQLNVVRMSARVAASNTKCRKLSRAMGFKEEGLLRKAFDGTDDLIIYGLLKEECRFIRPLPSNGGAIPNEGPNGKIDAGTAEAA